MSWFPASMKKIRSKNEGARVLTRLYDVFSDAQGQLSPKSAAEFCPNLNSSKLFIVVLVTCKNEEDPIKNQRTNGTVNAHLISWPCKAQNIQNLENIR